MQLVERANECENRFACGAPGEWLESRRGGKWPVDRVWAPGTGQPVQTRSGNGGGGGRSASPPAFQVVESSRREDRDREAASGSSSMAEQAPSPHPRILYIEDNPESRAL